MAFACLMMPRPTFHFRDGGLTNRTDTSSFLLALFFRLLHCLFLSLPPSIDQEHVLITARPKKYNPARRTIHHASHIHLSPPSPLVINKSGLSGCPSGTHYPFPCGVTSHSRLKGCNLIPIFALFPRVCSFHAFPFEYSLVTIRCFLRQNSTLPIVWLLTSSETKGIQECFGKNFSAQIARRSR